MGIILQLHFDVLLSTCILIVNLTYINFPPNCVHLSRSCTVLSILSRLNYGSLGGLFVRYIIFCYNQKGGFIILLRSAKFLVRDFAFKQQKLKQNYILYHTRLPIALIVWPL